MSNGEGICLSFDHGLQVQCTIRTPPFLGPLPVGLLNVSYPLYCIPDPDEETEKKSCYFVGGNSKENLKLFTLFMMCSFSPLLLFVLVQQKMEFLEITFAHWFKQSLTSKIPPGEAFSRPLLPLIFIFFCDISHV